MPKIVISDEAERAIKAERRPGHSWEGGRQLPSGDWEVEFSEDTLERLEAMMLEGESYSDTILRLMERAKQPKPH